MQDEAEVQSTPVRAPPVESVESVDQVQVPPDWVPCRAIAPLKLPLGWKNVWALPTAIQLS
jgi:hypothetical protein